MLCASVSSAYADRILYPISEEYLDGDRQLYDAIHGDFGLRVAFALHVFESEESGHDCIV